MRGRCWRYSGRHGFMLRDNGPFFPRVFLSLRTFSEAHQFTCDRFTADCLLSFALNTDWYGNFMEVLGSLSSTVPRHQKVCQV